MESLNQFLALIEPIKGELVAFGLTLTGTIIVWFFRPKVKLIWGRSNNSIHFVPILDNEGKESSKAEIYAEKFYLQNIGRKPATHIEFVLRGTFPDDLSICQPRQFTKTVSPGGELVVEIPFIAPYELVIIDTVYINKRAAVVDSVKCAEALGRQVPFITNRNFGNKFNMMTVVLLLLGIAFVLRLLGIWILGS